MITIYGSTSTTASTSLKAGDIVHDSQFGEGRVTRVVLVAGAIALVAVVYATRTIDYQPGGSYELSRLRTASVVERAASSSSTQSWESTLQRLNMNASLTDDTTLPLRAKQRLEPYITGPLREAYRLGTNVTDMTQRELLEFLVQICGDYDEIDYIMRAMPMSLRKGIKQPIRFGDDQTNQLVYNTYARRALSGEASIVIRETERGSFMRLAVAGPQMREFLRDRAKSYSQAKRYTTQKVDSVAPSAEAPIITALKKTKPSRAEEALRAAIRTHTVYSGGAFETRSASHLAPYGKQAGMDVLSAAIGKPVIDELVPIGNALTVDQLVVNDEFYHTAQRAIDERLRRGHQQQGPLASAEQGVEDELNALSQMLRNRRNVELGIQEWIDYHHGGVDTTTSILDRLRTGVLTQRQQARHLSEMRQLVASLKSRTDSAGKLKYQQARERLARMEDVVESGVSLDAPHGRGLSPRAAMIDGLVRETFASDEFFPARFDLIDGIFGSAQERLGGSIVDILLAKEFTTIGDRQRARRTRMSILDDAMRGEVTDNPGWMAADRAFLAKVQEMKAHMRVDAKRPDRNLQYKRVRERVVSGDLALVKGLSESERERVYSLFVAHGSIGQYRAGERDAQRDYGTQPTHNPGEGADQEGDLRDAADEKYTQAARDIDHDLAMQRRIEQRQLRISQQLADHVEEQQALEHAAARQFRTMTVTPQIQTITPIRSSSQQLSPIQQQVLGEGFSNAQTFASGVVRAQQDALLATRKLYARLGLSNDAIEGIFSATTVNLGSVSEAIEGMSVSHANKLPQTMYDARVAQQSFISELTSAVSTHGSGGATPLVQTRITETRSLLARLQRDADMVRRTYTPQSLERQIQTTMAQATGAGDTELREFKFRERDQLLYYQSIPSRIDKATKKLELLLRVSSGDTELMFETELLKQSGVAEYQVLNNAGYEAGDLFEFATRRILARIGSPQRQYSLDELVQMAVESHTKAFEGRPARNVHLRDLSSKKSPTQVLSDFWSAHEGVSEQLLSVHVSSYDFLHGLGGDDVDEAIRGAAIPFADAIQRILDRRTPPGTTPEAIRESAQRHGSPEWARSVISDALELADGGMRSAARNTLRSRKSGRYGVDPSLANTRYIELLAEATDPARRTGQSSTIAAEITYQALPHGEALVARRQLSSDIIWLLSGQRLVPSALADADILDPLSAGMRASGMIDRVNAIQTLQHAIATNTALSGAQRGAIEDLYFKLPYLHDRVRTEFAELSRDERIGAHISLDELQRIGIEPTGTGAKNSTASQATHLRDLLIDLHHNGGIDNITATSGATFEVSYPHDGTMRTGRALRTGYEEGNIGVYVRDPLTGLETFVTPHGAILATSSGTRKLVGYQGSNAIAGTRALTPERELPLASRAGRLTALRHGKFVGETSLENAQLMGLEGRKLNVVGLDIESLTHGNVTAPYQVGASAASYELIDGKWVVGGGAEAQINVRLPQAHADYAQQLLTNPSLADQEARTFLVRGLGGGDGAVTRLNRLQQSQNTTVGQGMRASGIMEMLEQADYITVHGEDVFKALETAGVHGGLLNKLREKVIDTAELSHLANRTVSLQSFAAETEAHTAMLDARLSAREGLRQMLAALPDRGTVTQQPTYLVSKATGHLYQPSTIGETADGSDVTLRRIGAREALPGPEMGTMHAPTTSLLLDTLNDRYHVVSAATEELAAAQATALSQETVRDLSARRLRRDNPTYLLQDAEIAQRLTTMPQQQGESAADHLARVMQSLRDERAQLVIAQPLPERILGDDAAMIAHQRRLHRIDRMLDRLQNAFDSQAGTSALQEQFSLNRDFLTGAFADPTGGASMQSVYTQMESLRDRGQITAHEQGQLASAYLDRFGDAGLIERTQRMRTLPRDQHAEISEAYLHLGEERSLSLNMRFDTTSPESVARSIEGQATALQRAHYQKFGQRLDLEAARGHVSTLLQQHRGTDSADDLWLGWQDEALRYDDMSSLGLGEHAAQRGTLSAQFLQEIQDPEGLERVLAGQRVRTRLERISRLAQLADGGAPELTTRTWRAWQEHLGMMRFGPEPQLELQAHKQLLESGALETPMGTYTGPDIIQGRAGPGGRADLLEKLRTYEEPVTVLKSALAQQAYDAAHANGTGAYLGPGNDLQLTGTLQTLMDGLAGTAARSLEHYGPIGLAVGALGLLAVGSAPPNLSEAPDPADGHPGSRAVLMPGNRMRSTVEPLVGATGMEPLQYDVQIKGSHRGGMTSGILGQMVQRVMHSHAGVSPTLSAEESNHRSKMGRLHVEELAKQAY